MSLLDAAYQVLMEHGGSMSCQDLLQAILQADLWQTSGKTPLATLSARLSSDIKHRGANSRFVRTAPNQYAAKMPESESAETNVSKAVTIAASNQKFRKLRQKDQADQQDTLLTFADSAYRILDELVQHEPLHYRQVTNMAIKAKYLQTNGKTPEATLYAQIISENKRRTARGEIPRFVQFGKGLVGLRKWSEDDVLTQFTKNNEQVKQKLLQALIEMDPEGFERLITYALGRIGFEAETTRYRGDQGIDVRGKLIISGVIQNNLAVQVKRYSQRNKISAPVVQAARGALEIKEHGLIITTSDFTDQARLEAKRDATQPISLMNGEQLVDILVEHEIGVKVQSLKKLTLDLAPLRQFDPSDAVENED